PRLPPPLLKIPSPPRLPSVPLVTVWEPVTQTHTTWSPPLSAIVAGEKFWPERLTRTCPAWLAASGSKVDAQRSVKKRTPGFGCDTTNLLEWRGRVDVLAMRARSLSAERAVLSRGRRPRTARQRCG